MRNLFLLIIKYGGFLSFVAFEAICFLLIIKNNQKQGEIWAHSSNYFSGVLYEKFDNVTRYWNLSAVSDSLANENARLRAELKDARFQEDILEGAVSDERWQQHYTYISAEVVNNSINRFNNYMTINRGRRHGLEPRMAVIDDLGIIGVTTKVGDYYSSVMSLLNKESKIGASIKRNNYFGSLVWLNNNPTIVQLSDIPKHANVLVGDTIQTSGYSSIFPGGIPIGTVEEFNLPAGSNFFQISVRLFNDIARVKYVSVVNNLMKTEVKKIEEEADE